VRNKLGEGTNRKPTASPPLGIDQGLGATKHIKLKKELDDPTAECVAQNGKTGLTYGFVEQHS